MLRLQEAVQGLLSGSSEPVFLSPRACTAHCDTYDNLGLLLFCQIATKGQWMRSQVAWGLCARGLET